MEFLLLFLHAISPAKVYGIKMDAPICVIKYGLATVRPMLARRDSDPRPQLPASVAARVKGLKFFMHFYSITGF